MSKAEEAMTAAPQCNASRKASLQSTSLCCDPIPRALNVSEVASMICRSCSLLYEDQLILTWRLHL